MKGKKCSVFIWTDFSSHVSKNDLITENAFEQNNLICYDKWRHMKNDLLSMQVRVRARPKAYSLMIVGTNTVCRNWKIILCIRKRRHTQTLSKTHTPRVTHAWQEKKKHQNENGMSFVILARFVHGRVVLTQRDNILGCCSQSVIELHRRSCWFFIMVDAAHSHFGDFINDGWIESYQNTHSVRRSRKWVYRKTKCMHTFTQRTFHS